MSVPAFSSIAAKILYPESEEFEEKLEINNDELGSNALEQFLKEQLMD